MNWLLDVNVNRKLIPLLKNVGVIAESSIDVGWRLLTNGDLIEAAVGRGFSCMLTNDFRITETGKKSLAKHSSFSLVLLRLPQIPSQLYLKLFEEAWRKSPIRPVSGMVISWPG